MELEKELKSSGADVAAFEYVRRTREISRMTTSVSLGTGGTATPNLGGVAGQGGELFKGFSALGNRVCGSANQCLGAVLSSCLPFRLLIV